MSCMDTRDPANDGLTSSRVALICISGRTIDRLRGVVTGRGSMCGGTPARARPAAKQSARRPRCFAGRAADADAVLPGVMAC